MVRLLVLHLRGFDSPLFDLHHGFGIARPVDGFLFRLAECIRMEVIAAFGISLVFFHLDAIPVSEGIMSYAGHLP